MDAVLSSGWDSVRQRALLGAYGTDGVPQERATAESRVELLGRLRWEVIQGGVVFLTYTQLLDGAAFAVLRPAELLDELALRAVGGGAMLPVRVNSRDADLGAQLLAMLSRGFLLSSLPLSGERCRRLQHRLAEAGGGAAAPGADGPVDAVDRLLRATGELTPRCGCASSPAGATGWKPPGAGCWRCVIWPRRTTPPRTPCSRRPRPGNCAAMRAGGCWRRGPAVRSTWAGCPTAACCTTGSNRCPGPRTGPNATTPSCCGSPSTRPTTGPSRRASAAWLALAAPRRGVRRREAAALTGEMPLVTFPTDFARRLGLMPGEDWQRFAGRRGRRARPLVGGA